MERLEPILVELLFGFHFNGKLLALPTNIILEWEWVEVANAVAYYDTVTITVVKSFIEQGIWKTTYGTVHTFDNSCAIFKSIAISNLDGVVLAYAMLLHI